MPVACIVGIGSDIGAELAKRYADAGWTIWGTFRSGTHPDLSSNFHITRCDVTSGSNISEASAHFGSTGLQWDLLIVAAGTEEPIGSFWDCNEEEWDQGIQVNALGPLRLVRKLFDSRNVAGSPAVCFFSGSGTNNAAPSYSAYAASKLFLIKMCELLDAETPDTNFFIIGPGVVRTKIHRQTVDAGVRSGRNFTRVVDFLESKDSGTSHDDIYECVNWCVTAGRDAVGGRNISLVFDSWRDGGNYLSRALKANFNMYKLRRAGNDTNVVEAKQ